MFPTKLDEEQIQIFLDALETGIGVNQACKKTVVSLPALYKRRHKDEAFSERWTAAARIGYKARLGMLEDEAMRRAYSGVREGIYYKGRKVDEVRKYSDTLMIFLMKGLAPETYRDNVKLDQTIDIGGTLKQIMEKVHANPQSKLVSHIKKDDHHDSSFPTMPS